MIYCRCECGKKRVLILCDNYEPKECEGCDECGSTYALCDSNFIPLQDFEVRQHTWRKVYDPDTSEVIEKCIVCSLVKGE